MNTTTTFSSDFLEIRAALLDAERGGGLPLYATQARALIYDGNYYGKVVRWLDESWSVLPPLDVSPLLQQALTARFNEAVNRIIDERNWRLSNNESTHTSACRRVTHGQRTLNFKLQVMPLWSLWMGEYLGKNQESIRALVEPLPPGSALECTKRRHLVEREIKWVQFEGQMQMTVPVALLAKLGNSTPIYTVKEANQLTDWAKKLQLNRDFISTQQLTQVLADVVEASQRTVTLAKIVRELENRGYKGALIEDPIHMDWREKLKPGNRIKCNSVSLQLGAPIGNHRLLGDRFKVFEVENHPDWVVKIANNPLLLLIEEEKRKSEEEHWGVRLAQVIPEIGREGVNGCDADGRCVVVEKLFSPLSAHIWTSKGFPLDKEDERLALAFANHIFCMKEWQGCPEELSLDHLLQDNEGTLKTTRLLKKGPPNYLKWEEMCIKAANGNAHVLHFLIAISKLNEHPIASYFKGAVTHVLQTGETDLIGRELPFDHRNTAYDEGANEVCTAAFIMRTACINEVIAHLRQTSSYKHDHQKSVATEVAKRLVQLYCDSPTPGALPRDLKERVVRSFVHNEPTPQKSKEAEAETERYFTSMYNLMMKLNEAT